MNVNLRALIGRLNATTRRALEDGAALCVSRTHYEVEVEHFLLKLMDSPQSDLTAIIRHFGVDPARLSTELARSLDRLKTGNPRTPSINQFVVDALVKGWAWGSIEFGGTLIRTGFVVLALVGDSELSGVVFEFSNEMRKIEPDGLRRDFLAIVGGSDEAEPLAASPESGARKVSGGPHIFLSYRREDSAFYADFLFACLRAEVPDVHVFRDTDTLEPGMMFSEKIEEAVAACDIVVALIGKKWTGAKDGDARRIDQEHDWVRRELAAALRLKKWVIPCLVGGAKMPAKEQLPPDVAALSERHGVTLSQKGLRRDVEDLLDSLRKWRRPA